jgi:hypothetical protein
VKRALDKFFLAHAAVSKDVATWGSSHAAYEREILVYYGTGNNRGNMTDGPIRHNNLKVALNG